MPAGFLYLAVIRLVARCWTSFQGDQTDENEKNSKTNCNFISCGTACACILSADSAYRQSVEKWRQDYQASLASDSGWLTVSGFFWLKEDDNRLGSAPSNDFVPPASAPASGGMLSFHVDKTTVRANPAVPVTLNEKPVETAELKSDSSEDRLVLGDLTLFVQASGDRLALRVKDKNLPLRKNSLV